MKSLSIDCMIIVVQITNGQRRETFQEAKEIDEKYVDVWKDHFRYTAIENREGGIEQKIIDCVEIISQLIDDINEK